MKRKKKAKREEHSTHSVFARVKNWELARREAAVTFNIRRDGIKTGTLKVGRGSIAWKPANGKKSLTFSWTYFAENIGKL
jgi:hypothetical protein